MPNLLSRLVRLELAPPRYLSIPAAGIDISTSGVKVAVLGERLKGIELIAHGEAPLPEGAIAGGEIRDPGTVAAAISALAKKHHLRFAHIALPEARTYLFEAEVAGPDKAAWLTLVEPRIDEYVPLPPAEVVFDLARVGSTDSGTSVVGIGSARRAIEASLAVLDGTKVAARSIESETFSMARALLPFSSDETVLIIDIGKTTTKLIVVTAGVPRFATTLDIGGHALTVAVMKHFGVSEEEARAIKAERGLVSGEENDEYVSAMLFTASAMREEIVKRLVYWQGLAGHAPVTRAILTGGNASVRGLPEYFETSLKIPVALGDVFTNMAPRELWLPPIDFISSLAYATAIGLALRSYAR